MTKHLTFTPQMVEAVRHYTQDPTHNRTAAYRAAFDCEGATAHNVNCRASKLFKHPLVAEAVKHIEHVTLAVAAVDAQWVTDRLVRLAEFNISKFMVVRPDGTAYYNFTDATEDDWYCIDEYSVDTVMRPQGGEVVAVEKVRLKTVPRTAALKMIGDLAGVQAFRENLGLSGPDGGPIAIRNFNDFYDDPAETEPTP